MSAEGVTKQMFRATPVQMRQSLEAVEHFKKAGIRFVPMPVFDDDEHAERVAEMQAILDKVE